MRSECIATASPRAGTARGSGDRARYARSLLYLTPPIHARLVRPMIAKIFADRREVIARVPG